MSSRSSVSVSTSSGSSGGRARGGVGSSSSIAAASADEKRAFESLMADEEDSSGEEDDSFRSYGGGDGKVKISRGSDAKSASNDYRVSHKDSSSGDGASSWSDAKPAATGTRTGKKYSIMV